jgi:sec-independent protein translocase protein TatC
MNLLKQYILHVHEVRRILLKCLALFFVLFIICLTHAQNLYKHFMGLVITMIPHAAHTAPTLPIIAPSQLSFTVTLLLLMPYLLYQLWQFIAPAVYHVERKRMVFLLGLSIGLFYLAVLLTGMIASILFTINHINLDQTAYTQLITHIQAYTSLTSTMMIGIGTMCQVPLVIIVLNRSDCLHLDALKAKRRYWIIAAFLLGMLLTPPDVASQILFALPMCFVFELGILLAPMFKPTRKVLAHATLHCDIDEI